MKRTLLAILFEWNSFATGAPLLPKERDRLKWLGSSCISFDENSRIGDAFPTGCLLGIIAQPGAAQTRSAHPHSLLHANRGKPAK